MLQENPDLTGWESFRYPVPERSETARWEGLVTIKFRKFKQNPYKVSHFPSQSQENPNREILGIGLGYRSGSEWDC